MAKISDVAFTPTVKAWQERFGSRGAYQRLEEQGNWETQITPDLAAFLAERDSFYLGSASAEGQPYIQHRGGPKGFLRVLNPSTLAFADLRGNKQYISMGNLSDNDRVHLFVMDYPNRQRVKIWGRATLVEQDPALMAQLVDASAPGRPERAVVIHVETWDISCPQHITPRYTQAQMAPTLSRLRQRIAELEARVAELQEDEIPTFR